jgi:hypothetical protein
MEFGRLWRRATPQAVAARRGPIHILIAAMPKSGSTFLVDVIKALPGFSQVILVPSFGRREHELDPPRLSQVNRLNYVAKHHVRRSDWTEDMRQTFGLKPVVLVRSLFDVIISYRDHVRRESTASPMAFLEPRHAALDDAALEEMIARLAIPWYLNFYMGWRQAPEIWMISYEELIASPSRVVRELLAFARADVAADDVESALALVRGEQKSRFNVGIVGRGGALRPETVRVVLDLLDLYPEAAGDPYIDGIKAQGLAALKGETAPRLGKVALEANRQPIEWRGQAIPGPSVSLATLEGVRRFFSHYGYSVGFLVLALAYWVWPNDLVPDDQPYGLVDDVTVLVVFSLLAGIVIRRPPSVKRLRRRLAHIFS